MASQGRGCNEFPWPPFAKVGGEFKEKGAGEESRRLTPSDNVVLDGISRLLSRRCILLPWSAVREV